MSLESLFTRGIPLSEASSFFVGIRKFAAPTDPPDETGELEGMFSVPVEQALALMLDQVKKEFESAYAYHTYAQTVRDLSHDALAEHFLDHAADELDHYDFLTRRMSVLGGAVHAPELEAPHPSSDPVDIIKTMIRMEQEGIAGWRALLDIMGSNPMKVTIEDYAAKEQEHLDDLWQLLPDECKGGVEPGQPVLPGPDEAMAQEPPPEAEAPAEEVPIEEKAAAMRMAKIAEDMISGGKGDKKMDADFDPKQMAMGEEVEQEHAQGNKPLAREVARDHLTEFGDYYSRLKTMEDAAKAAQGEEKEANGNEGDEESGRTPTPEDKVAIEQFIQTHPGLKDEDYHAFLEEKGIKVPLGEAAAYELARQSTQEKAAAMRMSKAAAEKTKPTDEELKETGRQRAVTTMASEAHREKSRRGERFGQALGSLGGAAAGAAAGRKYMGGTVGTFGGGALGYLAGGKVGKELGTERDIAKNAAAGPRVRGVYAVSPAQQRAMYSNMVSSSGNWGGMGGPMTFGGNVGGMGLRPADMALLQSVGAFKGASIGKMAAAMRMSLVKMAQEPGEAGGDAGAAMSSPTAGEFEAQNYLGAELMGRQAQEQNESAYYREQLGQAQQTAQMAQQQMADTQMQLQQLQQQAQEAGAQIQAATQQAVAAQDSATQQTLEAAKARIGAQEMRAKMLELASQDPQMLGEQAMAPPPPAPGMEQNLAPPGMGVPPEAGAEAPTGGEAVTPEGPAASAPEPATPPGAAPPGPPGGLPPGAPGPAGAPPGGGPVGGSMTAKVGAALAHRALGAGLGAVSGVGGSLYLGSRQPALAEKVQQLQGAQDGGFLQAAQLAAAKRGLAAAELAQGHPVGSAIVGGLAGAIPGAISGPRLAEKAIQARKNIRDW